ncbi:hypothetical protein J6590_059804 [Homalodisca vitripennis]|nr:hypothetical protein J6590_059804 [Homalodisca vitripennis]
MAEGSSTSASFRAAERVVLDENRILQALQEDVESDVETGAETDIGSDVDEIEQREDDACRNSDTEQSDEDSENDGPVSDDEIPLAYRGHYLGLPHIVYSCLNEECVPDLFYFKNISQDNILRICGPADPRGKRRRSSARHADPRGVAIVSTIAQCEPSSSCPDSPSWHAGGTRLTRTHSLTVSVSVFLFGVSVCGEMSEPKPCSSRECTIDSESDEFSIDREPGKKSSRTSVLTSSKVRKFTHKYRPSWEQHEEFKQWLRPSKKGELYFFCKVCGEDNKGGLSAVKKHCKTEKHAKHCKSFRSTKTIIESFTKPTLLETKAKEVDESTDRFDEKHLAVVVRTCTGIYEVLDEFLCLLNVVDGTAIGLYNLLTDFFKQHNIPFKENMVGFAADGTNTMMGVKNSLQAHLKNDIPNLFVMKCICHSLALCASYACEKLPNDVEELIMSACGDLWGFYVLVSGDFSFFDLVTLAQLSAGTVNQDFVLSIVLTYITEASSKSHALKTL